MKRRSNIFIVKVMEISDKLFEVADNGEQESDDNGCAVLFGVVRDCAYKMKGRAQQEKEDHMAAGYW